MDFDETIAVEYINDILRKNGIDAYPEDEILNVVDMIWDYYEENGLLDIDSDDSDDDSIPVDEIVDYVARMVKKDKSSAIRLEDIPMIVDAELSYEESLDEA